MDKINCVKVYIFMYLVLSLTASGEHLKLAKGLFSNGPEILPKESSFEIVSSTAAGLLLAELELFEVKGRSGPSKSSKKPFVKPSIR